MYILTKRFYIPDKRKSRKKRVKEIFFLLFISLYFLPIKYLYFIKYITQFIWSLSVRHQASIRERSDECFIVFFWV